MAGELTSLWLSRGAGVVMPSPFDPRTVALLARMSVQPDAARTQVINDLIVGISGIFAKLDALYVLAAHDAQAARLNWIQAASDITAVSSPNFTTDRGYAGNGTSSYLDTNWAPSTAGGQFALNAATELLWSRTDALGVGNDSNADGGTASAGSSLNIKALNGAMIGRANVISGGVFSASPGPASAAGLHGWTRVASGFVIPIFDGVAQTQIAHTADGIGPGNMYICRGMSGYSTKQFAAAAFGALSAAECLTLRNALATYLTAVGAL